MEGGRPGTPAVLITMSFCDPLNHVVLCNVPPLMEVLQGSVAFSPSSIVTFDRAPSTTARTNNKGKINEKWKQILAFWDYLQHE